MASDPLSGRVVLGVRSFLALLLGVVGFFMVVLAALMPGTAAVLVVKLFAAYALLEGLLSIFAAARAVRRASPRLLIAAALSLVFGLSLLGWRPPDLLSAVWRLAVYALLLGVLRLVVTLRLQGPGQAPVHSPVSVRKR